MKMLQNNAVSGAPLRHDVETTLYGSRHNFVTLHRRCLNVVCPLGRKNLMEKKHN